MQTIINSVSSLKDNVYLDLAENRAAYANALDNAVSELVDKAAIGENSVNQFYKLREQLLVWCRDQLASNAEIAKSRTWANWGWQPYISEPEIRIGLLEIYKNDPIPIHDHPGASGILLVFEGELVIKQYELEHVVRENRMNLANLSMRSQQRLANTQYAFITPGQGNIHSLDAVSDVCIVLDVLLTPYDEKQRSWFLPVNNKTSHSRIFTAFRLNEQTFTKNNSKVV